MTRRSRRHATSGEVATALVEARPQRIDRVVLIDTPPTDDAAFDGIGHSPMVEAPAKTIELLENILSPEWRK